MARLLLRFDNDRVHDPVTSQVILELRVPLNIMSAHVSQQGGEILVDVPAGDTDAVAEAFRRRGVSVEKPRLIEKDESSCTSCGACVSLCPMNALKFGDGKVVELDDERCNGVTCGLCVDACPVRAIRILG